MTSDQIGIRADGQQGDHGVQRRERDPEQRADVAAAEDQERGQQLRGTDHEEDRAPHREVAEQQLVDVEVVVVGQGSDAVDEVEDAEDEEDDGGEPRPSRTLPARGRISTHGRNCPATPGDGGSLESDEHTPPARAGESRQWPTTHWSPKSSACARRTPSCEKRALTRARLRSASSVGLLVLGCGLAALSVVAIWLRVTLLDTDRYVKTVAPIAAEPAVQQAVANRLDTAINSASTSPRWRARCCPSAQTCSRP